MIALQKHRADVTVSCTGCSAIYVESACNGDMNTFVSSGFVAQTKSPRPPEQPVAGPAVSVDPGSGTGQLVATLKAVSRARMYNIRFAPVPAAGGAITWTTIEVATAKPGVPINNLMPGTIYTFQARAFGKLGFSDWSDPVNRMCI
jgi:tripartite-type tricarboxylate transporter receptor subunit TctC